MGCFGQWNKLVFFGDTLAHSSMLAFSLGIILNISGDIFVLLSAGLIAWFLSKQKDENHTSLAIISYTSLAFSMILIALFPGKNLNIEHLLFGDVLQVQTHEIFLLFFVAVIVNLFLYANYKNLLKISLLGDYAVTLVKKFYLLKLGLYFAYALMLGIGMRYLGALFIPALAILPASAARLLAKSPHMMILRSLQISLSSCVMGFYLSLLFDLPTGAVIISCLACYYYVTAIITGKKYKLL